MDREIEAVKKEYEEKQKLKREKRKGKKKDEDKEKEKDAKGEEEEEDKKDEKAKEDKVDRTDPHFEGCIDILLRSKNSLRQKSNLQLSLALEYSISTSECCQKPAYNEDPCSDNP